MAFRRQVTRLVGLQFTPTCEASQVTNLFLNLTIDAASPDPQQIHFTLECDRVGACLTREDLLDRRCKQV